VIKSMPDKHEGETGSSAHRNIDLVTEALQRVGRLCVCRCRPRLRFDDLLAAIRTDLCYDERWRSFTDG